MSAAKNTRGKSSIADVSSVSSSPASHIQDPITGQELAEEDLIEVKASEYLAAFFTHASHVRMMSLSSKTTLSTRSC